MKSVPVLLLTLSICAPVTLAAPASPASLLFTRDADMDGEMNASPVNLAADNDNDEALSASTATPFFTPAVFLENYYSQTPSPPAPSPEPTNAPNAEILFLDPFVTESPFHSDSLPSQSEDGQTMPTATLDYTPTPATMAPTYDTLGMQDATITSTANPTPLETTTQARAAPEVLNPMTSMSIHRATPTSTPTKVVDSQPTHTRSSAAESRQTLQSRKAAIIGTLLALGSLIALMLCAFCMKLRLPKALRRNRTTEEARTDYTKDPEKTSLVQEKSNSQTYTVNTNGDTLLEFSVKSPQVVADSIPFSQPEVTGWQGRQHQMQHKQDRRVMPVRGDGQFEDVTHILSEDTFAVHDSDSGSERSSTSSQANDSISGDRQSHGGASVAQSYATCESRYSTPSVVEGADESLSEEQTASFHSAPSPPESPVPETPKHVQQFVTVGKRPRSKTLVQIASPLANDVMSSSKSFPARYSNRSSEQTSRLSLFSDDSEWDIAADYGARYSRGGASTPHPAADYSASENIEAIDIGGRTCVLVQG